MQKYLKILVEDIHSTTVATIGADGHPQTRVIDMMLYDEKGVYFLTAKGKVFYEQLMEQQYIAISAIKDKMAISLRGKIKNIGYEKLDEIFEKNKYMQKIYPDDTRSAHIVRESIVIGEKEVHQTGYFVGEDCIGCKLCYSVCPQKCIDISSKPVVINQSNCLHCGNCAEICPKQCIEKRQ